MSSDYIARLRAELLRAGATQQRPRRRARAVRRLRPLAVAVAVALVVAAVALTVPGERRDEVPVQSAGTLTYRVHGGDAGEAARIVRERLSAAGIGAEVAAGVGTLTITAPDAARADVAVLTAPGRFAIYDWERSVLGSDARPAPADPDVTGGPGAGQTAALSEAEARERAARRPGARALRTAGGWFALAGDPALTNADVAKARAERDRAGGGPAVALDLTPAGQRAFTELTRELARRGADRAMGGDPLETSQHLALVLDDRIVSTPYINWREAPDGIDGAQGASMSGLATLEQARLTAALLSAGPLAGPLEPTVG
jgi:preprotein translocase subunit SecD